MKGNGKYSPAANLQQPYQIQIHISEKLYLKDPESTELGQKIVSSSIDLIDDIGFEHFTFKKLAKVIHSTEASIYRYFENKHKLLIYLVSWYWNWLAYRLYIETYRVEASQEKLQVAIRIFCHTAGPFPPPPGKDINRLYRIVVSESPKAYLTKEVEQDNKEGAFLSYKRFCREIAEIVREINPNYPYPTSLVSTAVESAHQQKYFSEHLPSLTEVSGGDKEEVTGYLSDLVFRILGLDPATSSSQNGAESSH